MIDVKHVIDRIKEAKLETQPFAHFYAERVFKDEDYETLLAMVAAVSEGKKQKTRTMLEFDAGLDLMDAVVEKFGKSGEFRGETRLVLDREGYAIAPHTDQPKKAASLLFYMALDNSEEGIGTAIYTPKDPSVRCHGNARHKAEDFNKVWTAPFRRNSLLGFWKTDNSFHGVEKINRPITRNVLLYNIYHGLVT